MLHADSSYDLVPRAASTFLNASRFFEKVAGRGCFRDEGESAIRLNCDQSRSGYSGFYVGGPCIKLLAKVHGLDPSSTECRAYRWCGSSLACWNENTHELRSRCQSCLRHAGSTVLWLEENSKNVKECGNRTATPATMLKSNAIDARLLAFFSPS